jgi:type I restriction enzyme S subunit
MSDDAEQASLDEVVEEYAEEGDENGNRDEWVEKKIGEIFNQIYSGGTPKRGKDKYYEDGSVPFVKIEDLNRQKLEGVTDADEAVTETAIEEGKTRKYQPGTLLVTIYGSIAETAVVNEPVATNQGIIGLWGDEDDNTLYAMYRIDYDIGVFR